MPSTVFNLLADFYTRDETLHLFGATLALALAILPLGGGTRAVVRQTVIFSLLCLAGNLGAGLLAASAADKAAAVVHGLALLGLGIGVIRLLGLLVFRGLLPRVAITAPRILEDIVVIVGYLTWGLIRLSHAGLDLSSIVTTSAVITAVIAFAMQDTLGNVLGGLALQLDSSIDIGDWVRIDDVSGQVTDIRWRYTAIRTRNGETVVIPNSLLMKGKVWVIGDRDSDTPQWRRIVHFNVGYVAQPARVIAAIEQALREAEIANVAHEPAPSCVLLDFGPGYGHYALRYWLTNPALDDPTDSAVRAHIFAAVKRAGWRLALAEEVHHLIKENTAFRAETKNRELQRRIEALRGITIFAELSTEECARIAEHLVYAPFARGAALTHQGAVAHWLYAIVAGEAEVVIDAPNGSRHRVATLGAGDFFGEMGLLTGEPRAATVVALTDMECYRLDKAGFEQIIRERPAIAESISAILAARQQEREAVIMQAHEGHGVAAEAGLRAAIVGKIKTFFNLA